MEQTFYRMCHATSAYKHIEKYDCNDLHSHTAPFQLAYSSLCVLWMFLYQGRATHTQHAELRLTSPLWLVNVEVFHVEKWGLCGDMHIYKWICLDYTDYVSPLKWTMCVCRIFSVVWLYKSLLSRLDSVEFIIIYMHREDYLCSRRWFWDLYLSKAQTLTNIMYDTIWCKFIVGFFSSKLLSGHIADCQLCKNNQRYYSIFLQYS